MVVRLPQDRVQALQDALFGSGIHAGKGIVQDQDFGIANHGAGNGGALLLAARESDSAFANHRIELRGKLPDFRGDAGDVGGIVNFFVGCAIHSKRDIFPQRFAEQERVLRHISHGPPQRFERPFADRAAIDRTAFPGALPTTARSARPAWIFRSRSARRSRGSSRPERAGKYPAARACSPRPIPFDFVPSDVASHGRIREGQVPELDFAADFSGFVAGRAASLIFGSESRM